MKIRQLIKDSSVYGITGYLTVIAGIILTPIYTRMFTKAEYGILDIFNVWMSFAVAVVPLGLLNSIERFYFEIKDNFDKKRNYLGTIFSTILLLSFCYALLMIFIEPFFIEYLSQDGQYLRGVHEIYLHSIFIVIGTLCYQYILNILRVNFKRYHFMFLSILNFLILSLLGFVLVYFYNMNLLGFFRASSISLLLTLLVGFIFINNDVFILFNKKIFKDLIVYSVPLVLVALMFRFSTIIDRVILNEFRSLEDIGNYTIGVKISSIVNILFTAFATAWFPLAMSTKESSYAINVYTKVHDLFFIGGAFFTISLMLFRKELLLFFAPNYFESYNCIGILGMMNFFNTSIYFYSLGIHISKKTIGLTYSAIIATITNIVVSIILVQLMGIDGVAWGSLISTVIWILIQLFLSQKIMNIPFNFKLATISSFVTLVFYFLINALEKNIAYNFWEGILVKTGLLFIMVVFAFMYVKKKYYPHLKMISL